VDPDPEPHLFGSPGSGSVLGMRIRIQELGYLPKITNKPEFEHFIKISVPTVRRFYDL
jgi:hypothetical protein